MFRATGSAARRASLLAIPLAAIVLAGCPTVKNDVPPSIGVGTMIDYVDKGVLEEIDAPWGPLKVIRVQGSAYEMGYQYGYLLQGEIQALWDTVFAPLISEELGIPDPVFAMDLFGSLMDQAWNHVLPHTPQRYLDELDGVRDGAADAGAEDPDGIRDIMRRVMMLVDTSQAEAFGAEIGEMTSFFNSGFSPAAQDYYSTAEADLDLEGFEQRQALNGEFVPTLFRRRLSQALPAPACSFFAAWGDRTADGGMIASRVLDWSADMGLAAFGLITIFVPDDGAAHLTVGYAGMLSVLSGMNEHGISISAIGSSSVMDRLKTQSISIRAREILSTATNLDETLAFFQGEPGDGQVRATSIGTVAMFAYGDPEGGGANAEAMVTEFNGVFASIFRHGPAPECSEEAYLYEFDQAGEVANAWNHVDDPDLVNLESEACEVDASGIVRTFEVDGSGAFVYDATSGLLIDDPDGEPFYVAHHLQCATFRGDPAFAHGVRRWQTAANGPARDRENKLMHLSNVYKVRYEPHPYMLDAYYAGTSYTWETEELIPDSGGTKRTVGVNEAMNIIYRVGMPNANIYSIVYESTRGVMWLAFENGTGDNWSRAADNEYIELRWEDLLP